MKQQVILKTTIRTTTEDARMATVTNHTEATTDKITIRTTIMTKETSESQNGTTEVVRV